MRCLMRLGGFYRCGARGWNDSLRLIRKAEPIRPGLCVRRGTILRLLVVLECANRPGNFGSITQGKRLDIFDYCRHSKLPSLNSAPDLMQSKFSDHPRQLLARRSFVFPLGQLRREPFQDSCPTQFIPYDFRKLVIVKTRH
jgi:hypothetical protein